METASSSEPLVPIYQLTWCHMSGDWLFINTAARNCSLTRFF